MICPSSGHPGAPTSSIVSHIRSEVDSSCGELVIGAGAIEEVARAVECFVEQEVGGAAVDSRYLVMLASHALASLGEGQAARKLLLFSSGLVQPAEWEISGGGAMWVLDLKQLTVRDDVSLELIFFRCLNMIVDTVASAWDDSAGNGVLGLRHVCSAVQGLLGKDAKGKRVSDLAAEVRGACADRLAAIGRDRGWSDVPQVVNLDF